jgi:hypothetical protein
MEGSTYRSYFLAIFLYGSLLIFSVHQRPEDPN